MKSLVILPTYNERENISNLIPEILSSLKTDILVVDDRSPDGTGELAERFAREHPAVSVLHRPGKLGLGSAYVAGFRWALEQSYDVILHMDADLSHSPKDLPRLVEALSDCDLALGSRYVEGGGIENWPWYRLALSAFANFYARSILRIGVRDLTGGFKAFKRRVITSVSWDDIYSDGYAFEIESTFHAVGKGFKVREVPIRFRDRTRGKSKISRKVIWESIWMVWRLAWLKRSWGV